MDSAFHYVSISHAGSVMDSVNRMRVNEDLCDVAVIVGNARILAHEVILAAAVPFFHKKSKMCPRTMAVPEYRLEDVDESAAVKVIEFCYTSSISIDGENLWPILATAAKLGCKGVVDICCELLLSRLDIATCIRAHLMALELGSGSLLMTTGQFLAGNVDVLCTSSLLLSFTSQEITELLASLPCQYEKDGVLIRLTKAWLEHDPDSRRQAVPQLLEEFPNFAHDLQKYLEPDLALEKTQPRIGDKQGAVSNGEEESLSKLSVEKYGGRHVGNHHPFREVPLYICVCCGEAFDGQHQLSQHCRVCTESVCAGNLETDSPASQKGINLCQRVVRTSGDGVTLCNELNQSCDRVATSCSSTTQPGCNVDISCSDKTRGPDNVASYYSMAKLCDNIVTSHEKMAQPCSYMATSSDDITQPSDNADTSSNNQTRACGNVVAMSCNDTAQHCGSLATDLCLKTWTPKPQVNSHGGITFCDGVLKSYNTETTPFDISQANNKLDKFKPIISSQIFDKEDGDCNSDSCYRKSSLQSQSKSSLSQKGLGCDHLSNHLPSIQHEKDSEMIPSQGLKDDVSRDKICQLVEKTDKNGGATEKEQDFCTEHCGEGLLSSSNYATQLLPCTRVNDSNNNDINISNSTPADLLRSGSVLNFSVGSSSVNGVSVSSNTVNNLSINSSTENDCNVNSSAVNVFGVNSDTVKTDPEHSLELLEKNSTVADCGKEETGRKVAVVGRKKSRKFTPCNPQQPEAMSTKCDTSHRKFQNLVPRTKFSLLKFKCLICGRAFSERKTLTAHEKLAHGFEQDTEKESPSILPDELAVISEEFGDKSLRDVKNLTANVSEQNFHTGFPVVDKVHSISGISHRFFGSVDDVNERSVSMLMSDYPGGYSSFSQWCREPVFCHICGASHSRDSLCPQFMAAYRGGRNGLLSKVGAVGMEKEEDHYTDSWMDDTEGPLDMSKSSRNFHVLKQPSLSTSPQSDGDLPLNLSNVYASRTSGNDKEGVGWRFGSSRSIPLVTEMGFTGSPDKVASNLSFNKAHVGRQQTPKLRVYPPDSGPGMAAMYPGRSISSEKKTSPRQGFPCAVCGRMFAYQAALLTHMKVHSVSSSAYQCQLCQENFSSASHLKIHPCPNRIEKPYKCPHCDQTFAKNIHLKRHLATHSGLRPYPCWVCGKRFSRSDHLKRHSQSLHAGSRPHGCLTCGKEFVRKYELNKHMMMHTSNMDTDPC